MFRPGGYSSEEDLDDELDCSEYFTSNNVKVAPRIISDEEKLANQLDNFYRAVTFGDVLGCVKYINEGIDVNVKFQNGWTPLLLSASCGNDSLAIELIKRGADVNLSRDQDTPLMSACSCPISTSPYERSFKIVEHLVQNKADVTAKNRKRMTALMFAASTGNVLALKLLVQFSNKDEMDNQGWTALFWAVNDNHVNAVRLLLEADLDCTKMDVRRMTPLEYSKQNGFYRVSQLLPDPERNKSTYLVVNTHYDFYEEIKRLTFKRDIFVMLNGMKCTQLHEIFIKSDINLYKFLTLTAADLTNMGVVMPLIQNRILGALYRYHKHAFLKKSVPAIPKDSVYTTTDAAKAVFTALRQLVSMRASLKYLEMNVNLEECELREKFVSDITKMEDKLVNMEKITLLLKQRTRDWDRENTPVDLITADGKVTFFSKSKVIVLGTFAAVFGYYKWNN